MITDLIARQIKWCGGPTYFYTDDLPLPDVPYRGLLISLFVRLGRFERPSGSLIRQTYRYVVQCGDETIADQRGLVLMHPDQAAESARRWIDKYVVV